MNEQEKKQARRKALTEINLFFQNAKELPPEDFNKLYRSMRAIQSYLEKKVLEKGGVK